MEVEEVNMALTRDEEKPWKTDLARKSAQRRELVLHDLEDVIKKAASFEEALKQSADMMKRRFARYSGVTVYVADGEDLALHTTLERPPGPERVWAGGGPLADAAHSHTPTVVSDLTSNPAWGGVGLSKGSVVVAPIRTDAGLWAILEVWSEYRDAFTPQDVKLLEKVASALARKTPAA
jgi:putative methionine-R-sulfoxide reductase with GAF domain